MLETLLNIVFRSFWTFIGSLLLLEIICKCIIICISVIVESIGGVIKMCKDEKKVVILNDNAVLSELDKIILNEDKTVEEEKEEE